MPGGPPARGSPRRTEAVKKFGQIVRFLNIVSTGGLSCPSSHHPLLVRRCTLTEAALDSSRSGRRNSCSPACSCSRAARSSRARRRWSRLFDAIGVGQWFRYVTGLIEVGSAVALLVPSLAPFGAIALVATMAGAILTHLFIVGGSPLVPVILLVGSLAVAWVRRDQISSALSRVR